MITSPAGPGHACSSYCGEVASLDIGAVRIHPLAVGRFAAPLGAFAGPPPAELEELFGSTTVPVEATAFALETPDGVIMVDAGMGAGSTLGELPASLEAAGFDGADVVTVLLTHLHPDHANGLLAGEFPHARVLVSRAEADFVRSPDALAAAPEYVRHDYRAAADVLDAVADRLAYVEDEPSLPVEVIPLPGHAAGHRGFRLRGPEGSVLFAGDLMHAPTVQARRPDISVIGDLDPELAARTRREVLAACAADGTLLAGAHLGPAGFYAVRRDGDGFALQPGL